MSLFRKLCINLQIILKPNAYLTKHYFLLDVSKYDMVYYDPNTRLRLKGKLEDSRDPLRRISFHGAGCNCENFTCGCCTGINITTFNFDRHACTNFTYIPEDFAIKLKFIINERVLLSTGAISGKCD